VVFSSTCSDSRELMYVVMANKLRITMKPVSINTDIRISEGL
jgi:hypothetical protein